MLKTRRRRAAGLWLGFGTFGVIGWSVAGPTLLGALLGTWLDKRHSGVRSWTLSLLIAGLCLGCANAWYWLARQSQDIRTDEENDD
jgi:ATP synthase protein I